MMTSFCNDTVTRIRPGKKVLRGSEVPDWSKAESIEISNCSVQPASTNLTQSLQFTPEYDLTVYAPYDADVLFGDRIGYEGQTYTIYGEPLKWKSPMGDMNHLILNIKRWSND